MQQQILVSVALCTYNGARHLNEQIQSILDQTYNNIELVIVDDCSSDDSLAIIQKFAMADERIKYFVNTENLGYNKNFEKALGLVTGDFIAISDQDDIWESEKINQLMNAIGDNWLIFSNSVRVLDDGNLTGGKLLNDFRFGNWDFKSILLENYVTGHTCLMSRLLLPHILPFPQIGYYDWWMGFVGLYHHKLTYLDRELTQYRIHERSVTQTLIRKNAQIFKQVDFNNTLIMLSHFANYRPLATADKQLIIHLRKALEKKITTSANPSLIILICKHYQSLFPRLKKRSFFSKANFAIRYSKKL
ncbi:glycosyltransferase [Mucilaginibacter sp.]|uniref:glycosyltransferase n=1 Tax=Mucilaginibacter sp. TaxID=1882438 RepID=UPI0035BBB92F